MRLYKFHSKPQDPRVQERAKKNASPWKLGGLTPWKLSKRVYEEIWEDEVLTRSAALSFYFVAALVPMLFFVLTMLGFFAQSHDLETSLFNYAGRVLPPDAFTLLERTLHEIARNASGFKLATGLVLALWSGSGGLSSIMDALNRCYHVKDTRPYWKQKLISILLTIAIAALTIVALVIVLYGGSIAQFVGSHTGLSDITVLGWRVLQWPLAIFFIVWAFALMYYFCPDTEQQWSWITPGSLFGVLSWIGVSVLFRVYLHFSNSYSKTYGSLGAVIILLYWLFITGLAILIGGEINSEIENAAAKRGHPEAKAEGEKVA
ncbi:MAG TPA: YihY/virulence factor BrkB family protein [Candidatus Angelobacter sp.]|jgi:membrane protein|nr:YihY/virulence factor BrkB family protein [Candidatus Angelobacter sp.]